MIRPGPAAEPRGVTLVTVAALGTSRGYTHLGDARGHDKRLGRTREREGLAERLGVDRGRRDGERASSNEAQDSCGGESRRRLHPASP